MIHFKALFFVAVYVFSNSAFVSASPDQEEKRRKAPQPLQITGRSLQLLSPHASPPNSSPNNVNTAIKTPKEPSQLSPLLNHRRQRPLSTWNGHPSIKFSPSPPADDRKKKLFKLGTSTPALRIDVTKRSPRGAQEVSQSARPCMHLPVISSLPARGLDGGPRTSYVRFHTYRPSPSTDRSSATRFPFLYTAAPLSQEGAKQPVEITTPRKEIKSALPPKKEDPPYVKLPEAWTQHTKEKPPLNVIFDDQPTPTDFGTNKISSPMELDAEGDATTPREALPDLPKVYEFSSVTSWNDFHTHLEKTAVGRQATQPSLVVFDFKGTLVNGKNNILQKEGLLRVLDLLKIYDIPSIVLSACSADEIPGMASVLEREGLSIGDMFEDADLEMDNSIRSGIVQSSMNNKSKALEAFLAHLGSKGSAPKMIHFVDDVASNTKTLRGLMMRLQLTYFGVHFNPLQ